MMKIKNISAQNYQLRVYNAIYNYKDHFEFNKDYNIKKRFKYIEYEY